MKYQKLYNKLIHNIESDPSLKIKLETMISKSRCKILEDMENQV